MTVRKVYCHKNLVCQIKILKIILRPTSNHIMMKTLSDNKNLARHLYVVEGKNIKEIAIEVGVTERTIYTWIHQYAWKKLKNAAVQAPAAICENLSSQLVELQNTIAARESGKRFPTPQEAEVTRKLISSIAAINKKQTLAQHMQTMELFRDFVRPLNTTLSQQLAHYADKFFNSVSRNGYAPWQLEYGTEKMAACSPFYDELEAGEALERENPPAYPRTCKKVGDCNLDKGCDWPKCKFNHDLFINDANPLGDDSWALNPLPVPELNTVSSENPTIKV